MPVFDQHLVQLNIYRISKVVGSRAIDAMGSQLNSRKSQFLSTRNDNVVLKIDQESPGINHLRRPPSHIRFGDAKYQNAPGNIIIILSPNYETL